MKILQVNKYYYPVIGGVEKVVKDLADGLAGRDDIEMEVLVCQKSGKMAIDEINGIKIFRASSLGIVMRMPISLDFFKLYKKLEKENDLVILHHPFPLGFLAYILFSRNKKMVVWYHSDIIRQKITGFLISPLINLTLKRVRYIFTSSDNMIKNSPYLRKFSHKCLAIPYGIEASSLEFTELIKSQAQEIVKKYQRPIVLSVGRLVYYKGFEYLIKSFKSVDDAILLIIGEGPLKEELNKLILDLGLREKVFILDHVSDLKPYYAACKIFALPSVANSEAFGLVQMEAMAYSKPVINTNLPTSVPEVSVDMETGLTVEPKNAQALAEAINRLLNDSELYERLSKNAKIKVEDKFLMAKFLDSHKDVFLGMTE